MTTVLEPRAAGGAVRRVRPEPERRTVVRRTQDGDVLGEAELEPTVFGIVPNTAVLHQVVTAQLAAARAGTQSTRTRAEVRGGGAKPWRQKGTGRARQGSTRAPQWSGGGVALGPKPRLYRQRTPKKMIRLALCSALSDRAAEERVALVDVWRFEEPRTKLAAAALEALELGGRILLVLGPDDDVAARSFANLPRVQLLAVEELNAYDVLRSDWIVFTDETVPGGVTLVEGSGPAPTRTRRAKATTDGDTEAGAAEDEATARAGVEAGRSEDADDSDDSDEADEVEESSAADGGRPDGGRPDGGVETPEHEEDAE